MSHTSGDNFIEVSSSMLVPSKPSVSVLMVTHNHEKYLAQAIDGVVSQIADFHFELIIGEDCSTDSTRHIALDYQNKFPHIIRLLYSDKNVGALNNFARVYSASRGGYIAICEGDDYWTDNKKLQKQVAVLRAQPKYVLTYHDMRLINESNETIGETLLNVR